MPNIIYAVVLFSWIIENRSKKFRTSTVLGLLRIDKKCRTGHALQVEPVFMTCWNYWMSDACWRDYIKYSKVYPNYRHKNELCINRAAEINKYKYINRLCIKNGKPKCACIFVIWKKNL
jgi:hypothetical protein